MKINFDKLSIGALRKYQYRFKLKMASTDEPLISRQQLVDAIKLHFSAQASEVSESHVVSKFLRLKKEDRAENQGMYGLRIKTRPHARGGPTNRSKPANSLGLD
jgi:hypothetical protein